MLGEIPQSSHLVSLTPRAGTIYWSVTAVISMLPTLFFQLLEIRCDCSKLIMRHELKAEIDPSLFYHGADNLPLYRE